MSKNLTPSLTLLGVLYAIDSLKKSKNEKRNPKGQDCKKMMKTKSIFGRDGLKTDFGTVLI